MSLKRNIFQNFTMKENVVIKTSFSTSSNKNYVKRVVTLAEALNIEALYPLNSLNYEILSGDMKGISSIRIDKQYRLEFKVSTTDSEPIITICSIIDITNHYK